MNNLIKHHILYNKKDARLKLVKLFTYPCAVSYKFNIQIKQSRAQIRCCSVQYLMSVCTVGQNKIEKKSNTYIEPEPFLL